MKRIQRPLVSEESTEDSHFTSLQNKVRFTACVQNTLKKTVSPAYHVTVSMSVMRTHTLNNSQYKHVNHLRWKSSYTAALTFGSVQQTEELHTCLSSMSRDVQLDIQCVHKIMWIIKSQRWGTRRLYHRALRPFWGFFRSPDQTWMGFRLRCSSSFHLFISHTGADGSETDGWRSYCSNTHTHTHNWTFWNPHIQLIFKQDFSFIYFFSLADAESRASVTSSFAWILLLF